MKSIRTDPNVHAAEGDERIRTAEQFGTIVPAYALRARLAALDGEA